MTRILARRLSLSLCSTSVLSAKVLRVDFDIQRVYRRNESRREVYPGRCTPIKDCEKLLLCEIDDLHEPVWGPLSGVTPFTLRLHASINGCCTAILVPEPTKSKGVRRLISEVPHSLILRRIPPRAPPLACLLALVDNQVGDSEQHSLCANLSVSTAPSHVILEVLY